MPSPWTASAPTVLHDFSDAPGSYSTFQFGDGSSEVSAASRFAFGAGGLQVIGTNDSADDKFRIHKDVTWDLTGTGSDDDLITLVLAFEGDDRGVDRGRGVGVQLWLTDGDWSNYVRSPGVLMGNTSGWRANHYTVTMKKSDFQAAGTWSPTPDWANVGRFALTLSNAFTPFLTDISYDALLLGGAASKVPVTFSFDDCDSEQFDEIAGKLEAYGWRTTLAITTNNMDLAGKFTTAQGVALNGTGHRWIDHTGDHVNADAGSVAHEADILEGYNAVRALIVNPMPFHAHTSGKYQQSTIDYLESLQIVDARAAYNGLETTSGLASRLPTCLLALDELPMQFEHPTFNFNSTSGLFGDASLMNAAIDREVERACAVHLYGHYISTNPGTVPAGSDAARGFVTSEFDDVLAHLATLEAAGTIEVLPWHEWALRMHGLTKSQPSVVSSGLAAADGGLAIPPDWRY